MFDSTPTTEILARTLDVCALRQAVYSANIANAGVDGYRRMEVLFDAQRERLDGAMGASHFKTGFAAADAPGHDTVASTGDAVKLDEEMARMAQNALRYQMLLNAYERSASLLRSAIHEGREG